MPSVCRRRTPQQYPLIIKGYYIAVMTNCLAVVVGNFDPVEDKPLKELVTGLLDKKGTGYSLADSITRDILQKSCCVDG